MTSSPASTLTLHDFPLSGHCHRVRLFLSLLALPYRNVRVDLPGGEHKRAPFLALNPFGQVPVLQDGELTIADSNAILVYLAERYAEAHWFPREPGPRARVVRWLSVAAGEIANGPAVARVGMVFKAPVDIAHAQRRAHALLAVMNGELAARPYLAGDDPTIADVASYSYIAHAPEGGVSLADYPNVTAWLTRIEAWPRFVGMPKSRLPDAA